jgi:hypothetical protein
LACNGFYFGVRKSGEQTDELQLRFIQLGVRRDEGVPALRGRQECSPDVLWQDDKKSPLRAGFLFHG